MTIATATPHETYEGLRRQFMALRTLAASLEKQAGLLRRELKDQTQAQADLEAERATNAQLTETLLAAEAERDQLRAENEALRQALKDITAQVDGNIRPTARDCVNGLDDVQDIYGYCDQIEAIAAAAMKEPQP
ncbi:hypothetical protein [Pseudomonas corrugata]